MKAVAYPLILPLVKGHDVPEGDIDNEEVYKILEKFMPPLQTGF